MATSVPGSPPPASPPRPRRRWGWVVGQIAEVGVILIATGALALWCSVPDTGRLAEANPSSTAFIDLRRAQAEDAGKRLALEWRWRPLARISRYLRAAVIYAEDYNFYRHDGVDWNALEGAFEENLDKGSLAVGGSTITQQLAKNLYLSPNRSMIRKAREILIAFSLEDHLGKQRILELYLNVVEWGDGLFGAEAAAQHWFHHSAQGLSPAEAVRLAIALPNPIARAPTVHTAELVKKAARIVHLLRMQGLIDAAQEREALDQVGARDEKALPGRPTPPASPQVSPDAAIGEPDPAARDRAGSSEAPHVPDAPRDPEPPASAAP